MENPLISVVVPVYNTGAYLRKCIDSIINQDYKNIEIIMVDDGSTDAFTTSLCDELEKAHGNIRLIRKLNGGSSSARNVGIKHSKGEYIGFIDSDDYIDNNAYSVLMADIVHYTVKLALGSLCIEENGKDISHEESLCGVYDRKQLMHYFLLGKWHSACTNLYHKSLFQDNLFPEKEINEDYIFNFNVLRHITRASVSKRKLYHYIKQPGSNTTSHASYKHLDWIRHTEFVRNYIKQHTEWELDNEADYQYLFSLIVLSNKSLLSISNGCVDAPNELYKRMTFLLQNERETVWKNSFLTFKFQVTGILLSYVPQLYKTIILTALKLKKWKV